MTKWTGNLEPLEEELLACAAVGKMFDPRPSDARPMKQWGSERTIRAEVLAHLLVETEWAIRPKGIEIRAVRIKGHLDLEAATVRCPLYLKWCYLHDDRPVSLELATFPTLALLRCSVPGLSATSLTVTKGLDLSRSVLTQSLDLTQATIGGGLYCRGTRLNGVDAEGFALTGDRMTVSGGMYLNGTGEPEEQFTAAGGLSLVDADITGALTCERGRLTGKSNGGGALVATRLKVSGGAKLAEISTTAGAIYLTDADITGPLNFHDAVLNGTDDAGCALCADGLKVSSGAYLDRLTAGGAVTLLDASITGQLSFRGATITGERRQRMWNGGRVEWRSDGVSLSGDRLTATGGAWFDGGFTTTGAVRLSGAQISGMLTFHGAKLKGTDGTGSSLVADGITVSQGMYLAAGFVSAGAVELSDAHITGQLVVGQPTRPADGETPPDKDVYLKGVDHDGYSLVATRIVLTGDARFERFASAGAVRLTSAAISGQLRWAPGERPVSALDLSEASASRLSDDGNWPKDGQLRLAGFTYDGFAADSQRPWRERLEWIHDQYPTSIQPPDEKPGARDRYAATRYSAQPYEQLAAVYSQTGRDDDAREIKIAALRDRREFGRLSKPSKLLNLAYDITIRYGYRSWLAAVYLVVLYLVMFAAFSLAQSSGGVIVPAGDVSGLHPAPSASRCQSDYPCFSPAGFALDVVVPIINVHQTDNWRVNRHGSWGWAWTLATWLATLLGWALVTLFVAGYTGLVRMN